jgi:hypothetical protein
MWASINEICVLEPIRTVSVAELSDEWSEKCFKNGSSQGNKQAFGHDLRKVVTNPRLDHPGSGGSRHRIYKEIGLTRDGTRSWQLLSEE